MSDLCVFWKRDKRKYLHLARVDVKQVKTMHPTDDYSIKCIEKQTIENGAHKQSFILCNPAIFSAAIFSNI